jgi:hypothetical protein
MKKNKDQKDQKDKKVKKNKDQKDKKVKENKDQKHPAHNTYKIVYGKKWKHMVNVICTIYYAT